MISRNDPCWCGSGKKWKKCHFPTPPSETFDQLKKRYQTQYGILLKSPEQIAGIRAACQLSRTILDQLCEMAKAGITTEELNTFAHEEMTKAGAIPATLGYGTPPYPKSICTSLNEVICHGIPDQRKLENGDILNIDITSILDGYYGDMSRMVMIGDVSDEKRLVVETSYECLMRSIEILKPGVKINEIGNAITEWAHKKGCSVVYEFVGHGVGVSFHEPPHVPHHRTNIDIPLVPGMTFTIEPMINAGAPEGEIDPDDGWTVRTIDRKPSGQWEHTILITEDGHEILTI